ncbi:MAG: hypothetical protein WD200_04430 [Candidatus Andersenbacteria bacterium]
MSTLLPTYGWSKKQTADPGGYLEEMGQYAEALKKHRGTYFTHELLSPSSSKLRGVAVIGEAAFLERTSNGFLVGLFRLENRFHQNPLFDLLPPGTLWPKIGIVEMGVRDLLESSGIEVTQGPIDYTLPSPHKVSTVWLHREIDAYEQRLVVSTHWKASGLHELVGTILSSRDIRWASGQGGLVLQRYSFERPEAQELLFPYSYPPKT